MPTSRSPGPEGSEYGQSTPVYLPPVIVLVGPFVTAQWDAGSGGWTVTESRPEGTVYLSAIPTFTWEDSSAPTWLGCQRSSARTIRCLRPDSQGTCSSRREELGSSPALLRLGRIFFTCLAPHPTGLGRTVCLPSANRAGLGNGARGSPRNGYIGPMALSIWR